MIFRENVRPIWMEINLDHLKHNLKEIKRVVKKDTLICAVIKADAYGHGATILAKYLLENGVDRLAVATLSEAMELRQAGYETPILILGYTPEEHASEVVDYHIIQTVYSYEQALRFSQEAEKKNKKMIVHIKIDTGMSRLGFQPTEKSLEEVKNIFMLPYIEVEGIYTHFAVADEVDKSYTYGQFQKFISFVDKLENMGYKIPIKHASNSAAIIDLPEMNLDMVRAGVMLYGLYPSEYVNRERVHLKPVMELKARVAYVKSLPKTRGISYGLKYVTDSEKKIITLPIGYADGYTRLLSGKAEILAKGKRIPIVGTICMDQCMADATGIDIDEGDEVLIYSSDPKSGITVDDVAKKLDTINYEIVCMLSKRVPRIYLENNNLLHIRDSLLK